MLHLKMHCQGWYYWQCIRWLQLYTCIDRDLGRDLDPILSWIFYEELGSLKYQQLLSHPLFRAPVTPMTGPWSLCQTARRICYVQYTTPGQLFACNKSGTRARLQVSFQILWTWIAFSSAFVYTHVFHTMKGVYHKLSHIAYKGV